MGSNPIFSAISKLIQKGGGDTMALSNGFLLEKALEVVKSYASGGGSVPLRKVLRDVYEELKLINTELDDR